MRLHIEGRHGSLAPHLLGWIAEQLEALNTPDEDIFEAQVILQPQKRRSMARIQLLLAGTTLQVTQHGATAEAAINAGLQVVQRTLRDIRSARQRTKTAGRVA